MIITSPTLAQDGGGITVQDSKGTRTLSDTTQHTTLNDGTVVSTSTGKDGQANGGAGNGGGSTAPGGTGDSKEGW